MLREIHINELRIGMYIAVPDKDEKFASAGIVKEGFVKSRKDIDSLKESGVQSLSIDITRGVQVTSVSSIAPPSAEKMERPPPHPENTPQPVAKQNKSDNSLLTQEKNEKPVLRSKQMEMLLNQFSDTEMLDSTQKKAYSQPDESPKGNEKKAPAKLQTLVASPEIENRIHSLKKAVSAVDHSKAVAVSFEIEKKSLWDELSTAGKVYQEANQYATKIMTDIRLGKALDYDGSKEIVKSMIDSIYRNSSAISALTKMRKMDKYTFAHMTNVAVITIMFGNYLKAGKEYLELLGTAAFFHDIGKSRISDEILNKSTKLTDDEQQEYNKHVQEGILILQAIEGIPPVVMRAVSEHHERHDGTGYPMGLKDDAIGKFAKIISIVNEYDILTSERPGSKAQTPNEALKAMYQKRGTCFDPSFITRFIRCIGIYPVGSLVKLSSGEYGIVYEVNHDLPLKPKVNIVFNKKLKPKKAISIDLSVDMNDTGEASLEIIDCLDPRKLKIDVERFL